MGDFVDATDGKLQMLRPAVVVLCLKISAHFSPMQSCRHSSSQRIGWHLPLVCMLVACCWANWPHAQLARCASSFWFVMQVLELLRCHLRCDDRLLRVLHAVDRLCIGANLIHWPIMFIVQACILEHTPLPARGFVVLQHASSILLISFS